MVDTEAVTVRIERRQIAALDDWRRAQPDLPSRPEAIRRLAELGLAVKASGQLDVHFVDDGDAALLTGLGSAGHLEMRRGDVDQLRGFIEREQKKYPRL